MKLPHRRSSLLAIPWRRAAEFQPSLRPTRCRGASRERGGCGFRRRRNSPNPLRKNLPDTHVQTDTEHPTGRVNVTLRDGKPNYEILDDVAWDIFQFTPILADLAARVDAACFGSLAQRNPASFDAGSSICVLKLLSAALIPLVDDLKIKPWRRSGAFALDPEVRKQDIPILCRAPSISGRRRPFW